MHVVKMLQKCHFTAHAIVIIDNKYLDIHILKLIGTTVHSYIRNLSAS